MFEILLYACAVSGVLSIIVTDPPPTSTEYNYWYDIVDPSTGDAKSAHEVRNGDVVKGFYSVVDPDGTKRTVDYTADSKSGFQAIVRNEPLTHNQVYKRHNHNLGLYPGAISPGFVYPVPYLRKLQPTEFSVNKIIQTDLSRFFTPGNDTSSDNLKFNRGEYFKPNYLYKEV